MVPDFLSRSVPVSVDSVDHQPSDCLDTLANAIDPLYLRLKERVSNRPVLMNSPNGVLKMIYCMSTFVVKFPNSLWNKITEN